MSMFIPIVFACIASTGACENIPEKHGVTKFTSATECMAFVKRGAPKVLARFNGANVYVAGTCAHINADVCTAKTIATRKATKFDGAAPNCAATRKEQDA